MKIGRLSLGTAFDSNSRGAGSVIVTGHFEGTTLEVEASMLQLESSLGQFLPVDREDPCEPIEPGFYRLASLNVAPELGAHDDVQGHARVSMTLQRVAGGFTAPDIETIWSSRDRGGGVVTPDERVWVLDDMDVQAGNVTGVGPTGLREASLGADVNQILGERPITGSVVRWRPTVAQFMIGACLVEQKWPDDVWRPVAGVQPLRDLPLRLSNGIITLTIDNLFDFTLTGPLQTRTTRFFNEGIGSPFRLRTPRIIRNDYEAIVVELTNEFPVESASDTFERPWRLQFALQRGEQLFTVLPVSQGHPVTIEDQTLSGSWNTAGVQYATIGRIVVASTGTLTSPSVVQPNSWSIDVESGHRFGFGMSDNTAGRIADPFELRDQWWADMSIRDRVVTR